MPRCFIIKPNFAEQNHDFEIYDIIVNNIWLWRNKFGLVNLFYLYIVWRPVPLNMNEDCYKGGGGDGIIAVIPPPLLIMSI